MVLTIIPAHSLLGFVSVGVTLALILAASVIAGTRIIALLLACLVASVWPLKFRAAFFRGIARLFRTDHLMRAYVVAKASLNLTVTWDGRFAPTTIRQRPTTNAAVGLCQSQHAPWCPSVTIQLETVRP